MFYLEEGKCTAYDNVCKQDWSIYLNAVARSACDQAVIVF